MTRLGEIRKFQEIRQIAQEMGLPGITRGANHLARLTQSIDLEFIVSLASKEEYKHIARTCIHKVGWQYGQLVDMMLAFDNDGHLITGRSIDTYIDVDHKKEPEVIESIVPGVEGEVAFCIKHSTRFAAPAEIIILND